MLTLRFKSEVVLIFRGDVQLRYWSAGIAARALCTLAVGLGLISGSWDSLRAADVTAARLDGTTITGEVRSWNKGQVVIGSSSGDQAIAADQLESLRWPAAAAAEKSAAIAPGIAELTDGTLIPIESLLVTGDKATLKLPAAAGEQAALSLNVKSLAVVRFVALDEVLMKQWDEIRQSKPAGDLLVVRKRDGKSLDYVDGVLGEISADKVELKVDGEFNRADRAKVAGVIYLRTTPPTTAEPRVALQGRSGLRAAATNIELVGAHVSVTTPGGAKFDWPTSDLELADFSHGKVVFLSDIEPVAHDWVPLVGLPAGIATASTYGQYRRDQSAFGSALTLTVPETADAAASANGVRRFNKGLAIRSRTELVYRLPIGISRLTAVVGIEPATIKTGEVHLTILADDRPLVETDVYGNQSPVSVDVPLSGTKRLKIVVDYGKNLDTGDWLNMCDAKLIK